MSIETAIAGRFPAYPLIAHDPYFSVWSFTDELNGGSLRHWTGSPIGATGLARVDGHSLCWLGDVRNVERMTQTARTVTPTRTTYTFEAHGVALTATFTTPALLDDLDLLSRPVTYLDWTVAATDGKTHDVAVELDLSGDLCVNRPGDETLAGRHRCGRLELLSQTARHPQMLARSGDDHRIEWGHFYLAFRADAGFTSAIAQQNDCRNAFLRDGTLPCRDELTDPSVLAATRRRGNAVAVAKTFAVTPDAPATAGLMLAYDDVYAIEYLQQRLVAYWRRKGLPFADMLLAADAEHEQLLERCAQFDDWMLQDTARQGGDDFAALCAICYRQSIAAHKLVASADGRPYFFSKENFSNGCICTVDVTYPSAPLYLWLQPALLKGMLLPILDYVRAGRWPWPFAPHDLGQYPLANGQVYGGGERTEVNQMPVEECGNMLILAAALLRFHHDTAFVSQYWDIFKTWADYLLDKGYDPENQLCTDDFAGHLAHNTNLSLKAIMALGGCAQMADALHDADAAQRYRQAAADAAQRWQTDALDQTTDCYRLAFDQPGTWSQKYNLVWDRLLGLNLFPATVAQRELAYYRTIQKDFGLPLDNRQDYTKLDWILWSATLTGHDDDFQALLKPIAKFLAETPTRVPVTDWYWTGDGKMRGFQARSVVGGVFLKMLYTMK